MVFEDLSSNKKESPHFKNEFKFKVSLLDRFFSFLIDYLILSPFVSFILFLLFQDPLRYWRSTPSAPEQFSLTLLLAISYVFLFSLLQTFFLYRWRATPGQYYLKISLQFENDETFIFWRSLIRQMGFWFSFLLLGLPWLALLSHTKQKTFYDRLGECQVLSKKKETTFSDFENEYKFWQSFLATSMCFVGFLFLAFFYSSYENIEQRTESYRKYAKNKYFCKELNTITETSRLQFALAMNLVGQLSDDCLDKEADFVLWKQKKDDVDLAYFAKSMTEENRETEKKYLKQACQNDLKALGCTLAEAFLKADFNHLYASIKNKKTLLARTLTYELGLILNKDEDQKNNFKKLADFDTHRMMKKYLISEILSQQSPNLSRMPASNDKKQSEIDSALALDLLEDL